MFTKDATTGEKTRIAFVWLDRERRYFIATGSSLKEGTPYERTRLWQVSQEPNAEPEHITFQIKQPKAAEKYYNAAGKIDYSNKIRQHEFQMERKLQTKCWHIRVNTSIIAMNDVNTWLLGKACNWWEDTCPKEFHYHLAEEMIDNTWGQRTTPWRRRPDEISITSRSHSTSSDPHCTPTRCNKNKQDGTITKHSRQGKCKICGKNTMYVCSHCTDFSDDNPKKQEWLCRPATKRGCLQLHIEKKNTLEAPSPL